MIELGGAFVWMAEIYRRVRDSVLLWSYVLALWLAVMLFAIGMRARK